MLAGTFINYPLHYLLIVVFGRDRIYISLEILLCIDGRCRYDMEIHGSQSAQQVHCNACSIFQTDLDSEFLTSSHPLKTPGGDNYERYASWYATGYPNELEHYSVKAANWNETWKKQRRNEYVCAMATQLETGRFWGIEALPYPVLLTTISRVGLRMIQMPKKIRMLEEFVNCIANVGPHI